MKRPNVADCEISDRYLFDFEANHPPPFQLNGQIQWYQLPCLTKGRPHFINLYLAACQQQSCAPPNENRSPINNNMDRRTPKYLVF